MDIKYYTWLFHDGSIFSIEYLDKEIIIFMESAEVADDDLPSDFPLSVNDCIRGKLYIKGVKSIKEDNSKEIKLNEVKMKSRRAEIFHMSIGLNKVELQVIWKQGFVSADWEDFSTWEIECVEVVWENIPE